MDKSVVKQLLFKKDSNFQIKDNLAANFGCLRCLNKPEQTR